MDFSKAGDGPELGLTVKRKTKFELKRKRKNKLTNGHGGVIIQLRAAIFERIRNAQIKTVQTVSISLLSATFSCVHRL